MIWGLLKGCVLYYFCLAYTIHHLELSKFMKISQTAFLHDLSSDILNYAFLDSLKTKKNKTKKHCLYYTFGQMTFGSWVRSRLCTKLVSPDYLAKY